MSDATAPGAAAELAARAADLASLLAATPEHTARVGTRPEVLDAVTEVARSLERLGEALGLPVRTEVGGDGAPSPGANLPMTPGAGSPVPPLEVTVPVLGVGACPVGWVGAILEPGAPRPRIAVAETIAELVETVRQSLGIQAVGIDIPIGLPDHSARQADLLARRSLEGRSSSVLTTLTRDAYAAASHAEADATNRARSGHGAGAEAYAMRSKVLEVDAWVRSRPTVAVLEVHPELSFATMAGAPILSGRETDDGRRDRLAALAAAGIASPSVLTGSGYAVDDVLDACAVAWTVARRTTGLARPLPEPPEVFSDGLPSAIWA